MKLLKVKDLFEVVYGVNLDLNKLEEVEPTAKNAIRYVGRSDKNNGITAFVLKSEEYSPNPAMTISVAGGGSVMSSFLQEEEYYSGRDLFFLKPRTEMTKAELLFYCTVLRMNKFKFSYGRQANKTLENLEIPKYDDFSDFNSSAEVANLENVGDVNLLVQKVLTKKNSIPLNGNLKRLDELFTIINGLSSDNVVVQPTKDVDGLIPYIRPSKWQSTSYAGFVTRDSITKSKLFPKDTLYVSTDGAGSHTYSYVSVEEFVPNSNVSVLIPKSEMNLETKLIYAAFITANRFKFSYGRKPKGNRLAELLLPVLL
ncbi:restriction endonuclease subunit S [Kingella denitrificans]|jgi:hypothetical protein|uniref:restriction endonuclease subunit S n=1 Tax=Kingella denitrificans TaxID=502 RepID=UPI0028D0549E|nr:restriction endonuclease subunit S [Kingella denitrificans]